MLALLKFCSSSLYAPQYTANIDINDFVKFIWCRICNSLNLSNSSIINHDIKSTKRLLSMIYSCINLLSVTDIGNKRTSIYA
ncbi:hypothetical protein D3C81_1739760 [compost metagenome]